MKQGELPPAFVTYGWCRSAYAVIWSLGQRGIDVHIGDTSPLAMSRFSRYCKSFTKLPIFFAEPEKYFEEVCKALKKTGAEVLLPCHEDVRIFNKWQDALPQNVHIAAPDSDMWDLAEDQFDSLKRIRESGCPTPETFKISTLSELEQLGGSVVFPVVVKTRRGNSAKGVRIAKNAEELHEKFHELVETYNLPCDRWPIIQEYLPGDKIGVLAVYNKGQYVASVVVHFLRCKESNNFGTSTFRVTIDEPVITKYATLVLDALNWHGVVDMDFVKDSDGESRLIDINGRSGGATAMTIFAGVDLPYLWYLIALGQPISDYPMARSNVKSRWIIGECITFLERIKHKRIKEALEILSFQKNCYHDDFNLRDPMPLLFEGLDYFVKFIKAGGSMNPVTENMIR